MTATVLVVEDETDIRMLARYILEPAGHRVLEASSGEEAMALLEQESPDLILLDIRLPEMTGWDVLRSLKGGRFADVPVAIMSAHSSGDTLRRAQQAGSQGYLVKPFDSDNLLALVDDLVPRKA
jgi:CheY-like chemotaxis protein